MVHIGNHLRLLAATEMTLEHAFESVANRHADQPDVSAVTRELRQWSIAHCELLEPLIVRYPGSPALSIGLLAAVLFKGPRRGSIGLLRDLADLAVLAHAAHGTWTAIDQAAAALRDDEMKAACDAAIPQCMRQLEWIDTRIKNVAAQSLTVPN